MSMTQEDRSAVRVRIQALGGYRIVVDGRDLRLRTRKEAMLLLRLALAGDAGVSRDECVGLLWPDSSEARARHSLSEALRGIELATRVDVSRTPDRLSLPTEAFSFDVRELEDAIERGDVHACAELYKGGFLAGWYPPTAEASHWVDGVSAAIAIRLEKALRKELAQRRDATDGRGVAAAVRLLEVLAVATDEDREAAAEAEQLIAWESLSSGETVRSRILLDREGPFVGRVEEMKTLTRELERAMSGEVRVVLVSGEPGIGKTRTCQRLARLAALRGARLFMSTCYELEQSVAYAAVAEAFGESITSADLIELKPAWREALGSIMPLLIDGASDGVTSSQHVASRSIPAALAAILQSSGSTRTSFLHIDDVQWADDTSCQVLHYLCRVAKPIAGAMILLSFRPDELTNNSSAAALVRSCDRLGALTIGLQLMTAEEIRRQLEHVMDNRRLEEIVALAGGSPFFARELAMAGVVGAEDDRRRHLTDVIRSRASALTPDERSILDVVAVAGAPITVQELSRVTSQPVPELLRTLASLTKVKLIQDQNAALVMAHELTRQAFYTQLSEGTRKSLHVTIAGALEGQASAAFLANHYALGGDRRKAREYADAAAGESRRRKAFLEELRWLVLGLENADTDVPDVLERVVDRMFALAMHAEAHSAMAGHARDLTPRLRSKAELASLRLRSFDPSQYQNLMQECDGAFRRAVRVGLPMVAVDVLREKIRLCQDALDLPAALAVVEDLVTFAREATDDTVRAHALAVSTMKLATFNPALVEERLRALRSIGTLTLPPVAEAMIRVTEAMDHYNQGRIQASGQRLHDLVATARASGDLADEVRYRTLLVPISTEMSRFRRAERHGAFVIRWSRFVNAERDAHLAIVNLATCWWEAGEYSAARKYAEEAIRYDEKRQAWLLTAHPLAILGLCAEATGEMKTAQYYRDAVLERLAPVSEWFGDPAPTVTLIARLADHEGKPDEAMDWIRRTTSDPLRFPKIVYWQLAIEAARLDGSRSKESLEIVRGVVLDAEKGGCRLVVRKGQELLRAATGGA